MTYTIKRDGKKVADADTAESVLGEMHRLFGAGSASHAFEHEGYTVDLDGTDVTESFILR